MSSKFKTPYGTKITVNNVIGEGAFGVVYSATSEEGEHFAIKTVVLDDYEVTKDFCKKETKHIKKCRDLPFVMDYKEIFMIDNKLFIITPIYKKMPPRPEPSHLAVWFYQILYGLNEIHKKGIIHGDLKMGNVMLDESNNIKIIDFGISVKNGDDKTDIVPHVLKSKKRLRETLNCFENAIKKAKTDCKKIIVDRYPEASPYDDLVSAGYTILSYFRCGPIFKTEINNQNLTIELIKKFCDELNEISFDEILKKILKIRCQEEELYNFFYEFLKEILTFDREEDNEPTIPDILKRMESKYSKIIFKKVEFPKIKLMVSKETQTNYNFQSNNSLVFCY